MIPTPFGSQGGWGGQSLPSICATMTSLKAEYWEVHSDECNQLYHDKEEGFVNLCMALVMATFFYCAFKTFLKHVQAY